MDWISNIVDSIVRSINRRFHKTTCASECCYNRCECKNEGESSGEDVAVPTQHQEAESNIIFSSKLEIRRLSQTSINPPPPSTSD